MIQKQKKEIPTTSLIAQAEQSGKVPDELLFRYLNGDIPTDKKNPENSLNLTTYRLINNDDKALQKYNQIFILYHSKDASALLKAWKEKEEFTIPAAFAENLLPPEGGLIDAIFIAWVKQLSFLPRK